MLVFDTYSFPKNPVQLIQIEFAVQIATYNVKSAENVEIRR